MLAATGGVRFFCRDNGSTAAYASPAMWNRADRTRASRPANGSHAKPCGHACRSGARRWQRMTFRIVSRTATAVWRESRQLGCRTEARPHQLQRGYRPGTWVTRQTGHMGDTHPPEGRLCHALGGHRSGARTNPLIETYLTARYTLTKLAARFDVSRQKLHKWLARHNVDGLNGLADRSRAPLHIRIGRETWWPRRSSPSVATFRTWAAEDYSATH